MDIDINQPASDIHELDNGLEEAEELSSTRCIEFEKEIFLEELIIDSYVNFNVCLPKCFKGIITK